MTRQIDMFDPEAPFQRHSDTSRKAAEAMDPKLGRLQLSVYSYLVKHGPATDDAMQVALAMNPSTQRPRRIELTEKGLIRDSGQRGLTRSGKQAVLWAVVT